ncbi:unnamed protein product [Closterium sp. NIES-53]
MEYHQPVNCIQPGYVAFIEKLLPPCPCGCGLHESCPAAGTDSAPSSALDARAASALPSKPLIRHLSRQTGEGEPAPIPSRRPSAPLLAAIPRTASFDSGSAMAAAGRSAPNSRAASGADGAPRRVDLMALLESWEKELGTSSDEESVEGGRVPRYGAGRPRDEGHSANRITRFSSFNGSSYNTRTFAEGLAEGAPEGSAERKEGFMAQGTVAGGAAGAAGGAAATGATTTWNHSRVGRITKWRNVADAAPTNPADGGLSGSFRAREFRRQASFVEPSRAAAKSQPFGAPSNGSPEHAFVAYMAQQRSSLEGLEDAASFFCGVAHQARSDKVAAVANSELAFPSTDKISSGGIAGRNATQTASDKAGVLGSFAEAALPIDQPEEVSRALAVLSQWRAKAQSGRGESGRQQGGSNAQSAPSAGSSDKVASAAPAAFAASASFSSVFPLSSAASSPASPSAPPHSATFPLSLAGSPGSPPSDSSPTRTSSTSSSAVPIAVPVTDATSAAATALAIMPIMSRHAHARGLVGGQAPLNARADGTDGGRLSAGGESGADPLSGARRGSAEAEKAVDFANHSGGIQAVGSRRGGWGSAGECDEGQAGRIGGLGGEVAGAGMVPPRSHVQALLEDARSRREAYLRIRSHSASLSVSPFTFAPHALTPAPGPPPGTATPAPAPSRVQTFSRLDIPLSPHCVSSTSPSPSPSPSASLPPPLALYAGANSPPLSLAHIQLLSQKRGGAPDASGGGEAGEAGEGGGTGEGEEGDAGSALSQRHIPASACIAAASTGATGGGLGAADGTLSATGGAEAVLAWRHGEGQAQRRSGIPPLSPRSSAPLGVTVFGARGRPAQKPDAARNLLVSLSPSASSPSPASPSASPSPRALLPGGASLARIPISPPVSAGSPRCTSGGASGGGSGGGSSIFSVGKNRSSSGGGGGRITSSASSGAISSSSYTGEMSSGRIPVSRSFDLSTIRGRGSGGGGGDGRDSSSGGSGGEGGGRGAGGSAGVRGRQRGGAGREGASREWSGGRVGCAAAAEGEVREGREGREQHGEAWQRQQRIGRRSVVHGMAHGVARSAGRDEKHSHSHSHSQSHSHSHSQSHSHSHSLSHAHSHTAVKQSFSSPLPLLHPASESSHKLPLSHPPPAPVSPPPLSPGPSPPHSSFSGPLISSPFSGPLTSSPLSGPLSSSPFSGPLSTSPFSGPSPSSSFSGPLSSSLPSSSPFTRGLVKASLRRAPSPTAPHESTQSALRAPSPRVGFECAGAADARSVSPGSTLVGDAAAAAGGSTTAGSAGSAARCRFPSSRSVDAGKPGAVGGAAGGSRGRRLMKGGSAQERGLARIGERDEPWGAVPSCVSESAAGSVLTSVAVSASDAVATGAGGAGAARGAAGLGAIAEAAARSREHVNRRVQIPHSWGAPPTILVPSPSSSSPSISSLSSIPSSSSFPSSSSIPSSSSSLAFASPALTSQSTVVSSAVAVETAVSQKSSPVLPSAVAPEKTPEETTEDTPEVAPEARSVTSETTHSNSSFLRRPATPYLAPAAAPEGTPEETPEAAPEVASEARSVSSEATHSKSSFIRRPATPYLAPPAITEPAALTEPAAAPEPAAEARGRAGGFSEPMKRVVRFSKDGSVPCNEHQSLSGSFPAVARSQGGGRSFRSSAAAGAGQVSAFQRVRDGCSAKHAGSRLSGLQGRQSDETKGGGRSGGERSGGERSGRVKWQQRQQRQRW